MQETVARAGVLLVVLILTLERGSRALALQILLVNGHILVLSFQLLNVRCEVMI